MISENTFLNFAPLARSLVDFGLVVLIWLVQLIVYPSFQFTAKEHLMSWHQTYSGLISAFVIPLMFSQAFLIVYLTYQRPGILNFASLLCVILAWVFTFSLSVPCHTLIAQGNLEDSVLQRLVFTNWPRTLAWSTCFVLGAIQLSQEYLRISEP